jgi:hypothetical protein
MIIVGTSRTAYPGGNRAPFITADVQSTTGQWQMARFMIDPGADATYLPASYIRRLQIDPATLPSRDDTSD